MFPAIPQTSPILVKPRFDVLAQAQAQLNQKPSFDLPAPLQNMKLQVVKGDLIPSDPAIMAKVQEVMAMIEWMESSEGLAHRQNQIAIQNTRPVELAIYQGNKIIGFKSEDSGFTGANGMAGILPDGWGKMSPHELKQALNEELSNGRNGQFTIRTINEGLKMTTGQAMDILIDS